jgi:hypothetical protein
MALEHARMDREGKVVSNILQNGTTTTVSYGGDMAIEAFYCRGIVARMVATLRMALYARLRGTQ